MKVKIIRNTSSRGRAFMEGQTADMSDAEAKMLILCGKAKVLETATAEPVRETASAPKPTRRKRK